MNNKTKKDLFESYFHYWIIKFKLDKKYKFDLKQDNRMNCYASVEINGKNSYEVKYNVKKLTTQYKILHTVLHEIGHLFFDFRISDEVMHETEAEYFALTTIKKEKPKMYRKCIAWTRQLMMAEGDEYVHKEAYRIALTRLKEL